jgi:hypothetical protein
MDHSSGERSLQQPQATPADRLVCPRITGLLRQRRLMSFELDVKIVSRDLLRQVDDEQALHAWRSRTTALPWIVLVDTHDIAGLDLGH